MTERKFAQLHIVDILLLCYIAIVCSNFREGINLFVASRLGLLCLCYIIVRSLPNKRWILRVIGIIGTIEAVLAILQQLNWIESKHSFFEITGTFGNPGQLGGFLAVSLVIVFSLYMVYQQQKLLGWLLFSIMLLCLFAIILTDSRAGWFAAIAGCCFVLKLKKRSKRASFLYQISVGLILLLFCIGGYYYKKKSADGRLLIWHVTLEMITDAPLLGHGVGAFQKKYMIYQARYFERHPYSKFAEQADNVIYPYNELLHIGVELGLVGIIGAVTILIAVGKCITLCGDNIPFAGGLVSLIVFSMFSYPTHVLFLAILFPVLLGGMVFKKKTLLCNIYINKFARWGVCAVGIYLFARGYYTYNMLELNIKELFSNSKCDSASAKKYINTHYADLKGAPQLFDLYAQYSYKTLPINESLPILLDATTIIPTSELYCDLGDLYKGSGNFSKAIEYYCLASYMIPNRLLPKYKLFLLYKDLDDTFHAKQMGANILSTLVKVESTRTLSIKGEVKRYLEKM